jgi:hypothetical protein
LGKMLGEQNSNRNITIGDDHSGRVGKEQS